MAGGSGLTQPLHATVVQPGYPAHRRIVQAFGTEVLLENGDIDRKVLGDLIFNQPDRRQLLNSITHPEIRKEMMKETFKYFLRGETLDLGAEGDGQPPSEAFLYFNHSRVGRVVVIWPAEFTLFIGMETSYQPLVYMASSLFL